MNNLCSFYFKSFNIPRYYFIRSSPIKFKIIIINQINWFFTFLIFLVPLLTSLINNWLDLWLIIEINNFVILAMINIKNKNKKLSYIIFKFYSIQVILSFALIILILINNKLSRDLIFYVLRIKLIIAPFHLWFRPIIKIIDWKPLILILTVYKLPVFFLLCLLENKNKQYRMILILSLALIWPTIEILNENLVHSLIFLSSVYNTTWIVIILLFNLWNLFLYYFVVYRSAVLVYFVIINYYKYEKISQIYDSKFIFYKIVLIWVSLILIGLPPTNMFFIKITAFQYFFSLKFYWLIIVIVITTITWLYIFINFFIKKIILLNKNTNKFNFIKINMTIIVTIILPSIIM